MGQTTIINQSYSDKIDEDEPWRYTCPECGRQVYVSHTNSQPRCDIHGVLDGGIVYDKKEDASVKVV